VPRRTPPLMILVCLFVVCSLLVSACSSSPRAKLVGKWKDAASGEEVEFFKDGTVTVKNAGMNASGNYRVLDDKTIRVELTGLFALAGAIVGEYKVSGDTLELNLSGATTTYSRTK
jgi:hypothetical protein